MRGKHRVALAVELSICNIRSFHLPFTVWFSRGVFLPTMCFSQSDSMMRYTGKMEAYARKYKITIITTKEHNKILIRSVDTEQVICTMSLS